MAFFNSAVNVLQTLVVAPRRWPRYLGRDQPAGRVWQRQPWCEIAGVSDALHGQVIAVQRMVQFHTATD